MEARFGASKVKVLIWTHELGTGIWRHGSCTHSRNQCSVVDDLSIIVDGHPLFVPGSVFGDLADLNSVQVEKIDRWFVLNINGGDASESYVVRVTFNGSRIVTRQLFSALVPGQPVQQTTYFENTGID